MNVTTVDNFGGLKTFPDDTAIGLSGARDLLNVDIAPGRVASRRGTDGFSATAARGNVLRMLPITASQMLVLSSDATNYYVDSYSATGVRTTVGVGWPWGAVGPVYLVKMGTSTSTSAFISGAGTATMRKVVGTTLSTSVGSPRCLAVWNSQARLVQAGFSGSTLTPSGSDGSASCVFFSDPGAPETFNGVNFVHLRPGDGESIRGIASWRDLLIVFKETTMFVFYGVSTNSAGAAVFNYQSVDLPEPFETGQTVTAGDDGVYYASAGRLYRTTGDTPVRVNADLVRDGTEWGDVSDLSWAEGRAYVSRSTDVVDIWDSEQGLWTTYTFAGTLTASGPAPGLAFTEWNGKVYFATATNVWTPAASGSVNYALDNGTAFDSYYESGYSTLGTPESKVVREVVARIQTDNGLSGTLATTNPAHLECNIMGGASSGSSDNIPDSLVPQTIRCREAVRGRNFGFTVISTGCRWELREVSFYARDQRLNARSGDA